MNRSIEQLIAQLREIFEHNLQHEPSRIEAGIVLDVLETEIRELARARSRQARTDNTTGEARDNGAMNP